MNVVEPSGRIVIDWPRVGWLRYQAVLDLQLTVCWPHRWVERILRIRIGLWRVVFIFGVRREFVEAVRP